MLLLLLLSECPGRFSAWVCAARSQHVEVRSPTLAHRCPGPVASEGRPLVTAHLDGRPRLLDLRGVCSGRRLLLAPRGRPLAGML